MLSCFEALDKRKKAGRPQKELAQSCANLSKGKSVTETASLLGISERKAEQIRAVTDHADPDVKEAVKSGQMSINKAYETQQAHLRKVDALPHTGRDCGGRGNHQGDSEHDLSENERSFRI